MRIRTWLSCGTAAFTLLAVSSAAAQTVPPPVSTTQGPVAEAEEVYVFARGERQIGVAAAASEGAIGGADLLVRPLLRVAELLEAVPGMIAAQHSGTGKANQYFLRGFNLDHGSDFTTYIDDVQMNFRTHGHGQGYLDLNGLIPEVVDREDYRKGPYRADGGDFALAGAAYMTTIDRYDENWVSAEVGSYGWYRAAAGGTFDVGPGELTAVGQWKTYDGPWDVGENLKHYSGFAKYEQPTSLGVFDLTFHGYYGEWLPTEQTPERAIGTALCPDAFCALDPTAIGKTTRFISSARLTGDDWRGNVYVQYYDWGMYSNPVYFNPDGTSAQIYQFDKRWIFGLKAEKSFEVDPTLSFRVGTENRYDDIGPVGVHQTSARTFVNSLGNFDVHEGSASLWAEANWMPLEGLRAIGGLRGDYYSFDAHARDVAAFSGSTDDTILSPKMALAYQVSDSIELYANWGQGFHSNDARAAANPVSPAPGLVRGEGWETGARYQMGPFSVSATYLVALSRQRAKIRRRFEFGGAGRCVGARGSRNRRLLAALRMARYRRQLHDQLRALPR